MPRLKQIASSTFDLPEPFGPEIAVKHASRSVSTVRLPCDLKPSRMISMSRIPACAIAGARVRPERGGGRSAAALPVERVSKSSARVSSRTRCQNPADNGFSMHRAANPDAARRSRARRLAAAFGARLVAASGARATPPGGRRRRDAARTRNAHCHTRAARDAAAGGDALPVAAATTAASAVRGRRRATPAPCARRRPPRRPRIAPPLRAPTRPPRSRQPSSTAPHLGRSPRRTLRRTSSPGCARRRSRSRARRSASSSACTRASSAPRARRRCSHSRTRAASRSPPPPPAHRASGRAALVGRAAVADAASGSPCAAAAAAPSAAPPAAPRGASR